MRLAIPLLLTTLVHASSASAQAGAGLVHALAARFPEHEIVPRSCDVEPGERLVTDRGRLCIFDERTGLPRAVRRVSLGGHVEAALRGTDVVFGVDDEGGALTRFDDRAWRWDLASDAMMPLGNLPELEQLQIRGTSFGVLYRLRSGWWLSDGSPSGARRVQAPEELSYLLWLSGDTTFAFTVFHDLTVVRRLVLEGDRVRSTEHAVVPGRPVRYEGGVVITATVRRRGVGVRALALPSAESFELEMPPGMRAPTSATQIDASHWLLVGPRRQHAVLDLAARTITVDTSEIARAPLAVASSLVHARPTAENGLYVGRAVGGWRLDERGATRVPRTHPREVRARCPCEGTTLRCNRGAITVSDACTAVPELERTLAPSLYTNDGRFRIDRLEADHVRVTRLADGARLWVRLFDDALFAQTDDGAFFVSDRALIDRMAIRDGRSLLDAPVAPLAPRAESLFREGLIADFFVGSLSEPHPSE